MPRAARTGCLQERLAQVGRADRSRHDPGRDTEPTDETQKLLRLSNAHVDVLPRVHGSAIFTRGETQALDHSDAGNTTGRTASRWLGRGILQKVHARLQLPPVQRRGMQADSRTGTPRNRPRNAGRTKRQTGAARPGKIPVHDPRDLATSSNLTVPSLDGIGLWRNARLDGRRGQNQQPGRRDLVGLVKEAGPMGAADRHHGRRRSLWRHGFQDRRNPKRDHRDPTRSENPRHQPADHPGGDEPIPRSSHRDSQEDHLGHPAAAGRYFSICTETDSHHRSIRKRSAC